LTAVNSLCYKAAMTNSQIIDAIGGTQKVADWCGLGKSAVSHWRNRGIPRAWRKALQRRFPAAFKAKRNGKS